MDLLDLTVTLSRAGESLDLTGVYSVQAGVIGFDDAALDVPMDASPGVFGGFATGVSVAPRRIMIPVLVDADGGAAWQAARAALRRVRRATAGTTRISVRQPDATTRVIDAWPVTEPAQWSTDTWGSWGVQRLGLDFVAERPWWRSVAELSTTWGLGDGEAFLSDDPPGHGADELARLADSTVLGASSVLDVPGDEDTWPTWTVSGTKGQLTVSHAGSGRSWSVNLTGVTPDVTVTTDPTAAAVTRADGANLWSLLSPPFDLWPLPPGEQTVTVTMTGADATSVIRLVADGQYQSAA